MLKILYVNWDEDGNKYFRELVVPYIADLNNIVRDIKEYLENGKIALEDIEDVLQKKELNIKIIMELKNGIDTKYFNKDLFREELYTIYDDLLYNIRLKEFVKKNNLKNDNDYVVVTYSPR